MTYHPQAIDTSAENDRFFFEAIQKRSPGQRLQMAADVLGILKVQGTQLEWDYLRPWAVTLKLTELLDRALTATGMMDGQ